MDDFGRTVGRKAGLGFTLFALIFANSHNNTYADGPVLVPPSTTATKTPAPETSQPVVLPELPVLEFPSAEIAKSEVAAPKIPAANSKVNLPVPTADANIAEPLLTIPSKRRSAKSIQPTPPANSLLVPLAEADDDGEFVTVRKRIGTRSTHVSTNVIPTVPKLAPPALTPIPELRSSVAASAPTHNPSVPLLAPIPDRGIQEPLLVPPTPRGNRKTPFLTFGKPGNSASTPVVKTSELETRIAKAVVANVPHGFNDNSNWEKTKEVTTGVKLGFEGIFLKANKVRRKVNHGDWTRYQINRTTTKGRPYDVEVDKLKMVTANQFTFSAEFKVPLKASGQLQTYSRGVSIRGVATNAVAIASVTVNCTVDVRKIAPALGPQVAELTPHINSATVRLSKFDIAEQGLQFDGGATRWLSTALGQITKRQITKQGANLQSNLQKQFSKPIRVELNELLETRWGKMLATVSMAQTDKKKSASR